MPSPTRSRPATPDAAPLSIPHEEYAVTATDTTKTAGRLLVRPAVPVGMDDVPLDS